MDLLKKGQDLFAKLKPALMDDENVTLPEEGMAKESQENATAQEVVPARKTSVLSAVTSFFNGAGIGLLLGILVGLAISPVVSGFIGTLSGMLAILLGLSDKFISPAKALRLGAFGFFCVGGIFLGMHVRTNNVLMPARDTMMQQYMEVGFTEEEARDFIAYREFRLVPVGWKVGGATEEDADSEGQEANLDSNVALGDPGSTESAASEENMKKTAAAPKSATKRQFANENVSGAEFASHLYSTDVNLTKCSKLVLIDGNILPLREIKNTFRMADGGEKGVWQQLADGIDPNLSEETQKNALLAMRDCFCENEDLETLKITDCEKATAVDISLPLDAYKKNLSAVNKLWKAIVENTAQKVKVEDQKSTLISLTKNVCHE